MCHGKEKADCPVICLQNDYSDRYPEFYSITIENPDSMYANKREYKGRKKF